MWKHQIVTGAAYRRLTEVQYNICLSTCQACQLAAFSCDKTLDRLFDCVLLFLDL